VIGEDGKEFEADCSHRSSHAIRRNRAAVTTVEDNWDERVLWVKSLGSDGGIISEGADALNGVATGCQPVSPESCSDQIVERDTVLIHLFY
jgi:hypothetical protein